MLRSAAITASRRATPLVLAALAVGLATPALASAGPDAFLSVPLPPPLPSVRVLTLLVGLHLLGLCFGLGGATMLDFWIIRWMRWGGLPAEIARTFLFVSKVVSLGLGLLWLSGLGFLAVYALEAPEKLANPKIAAKLTVVAVLTLNGWLIHALVLPGVLRDVSRPMFDGVSRGHTGIFLISGAVSGVSWYAAFALGIMRELNGRVAAGLLLALWFTAVVAAALAAYAFWQFLCRQRARDAAIPLYPVVDLRPRDHDAALAVPPHPMRAVPLGLSCAPASRMAGFPAWRWPRRANDRAA